MADIKITALKNGLYKVEGSIEYCQLAVGIEDESRRAYNEGCRR